MSLEEKVPMIKKYLCGISFQHELGQVSISDISELSDSVEELKEKHAMWKECGIVEIETEGNPEDFVSYKWIVEQDLKFTPNPEDKKESDQ